jgi:hypothetical protein
MITWQYDGPSDGVTFDILVNNAPHGDGPFPLAGVEIVIPSEAQERTVGIAVRALSETAEPSPVSEAFPLLVPAATPASTEPATSPAPPTTLVGAGTQPPGATTTTTTTTSPPTSTTSPPALVDIQNLEDTWAAVLRPVLPPPVGPPLDAVRNQLSTTYGVPADEIRTFTNRDTLAVTADGTPVLAVASAGQGYFYVARGTDQAAAQAICDLDTTGTCQVLRLVGAARASEGQPIAILDVPSAQSTRAEIDERLDELRVSLVRSIHVLDGADYEQLQTTSPVIYARGFADEAAADTFCQSNALPPTECVVQTLQPTG